MDVQQGSLALLPHKAHRPLRHRVPGAVQSLIPSVVGQQGNPGPPQVPHAPLRQVPVKGLHKPPLLTHSPPTQQPPPSQVLPAQHALPVALHALLPVETVLPPRAPPLVPAGVPPLMPPRVPVDVPPMAGFPPPAVPATITLIPVAVPPVPVAVPPPPTVADCSVDACPPLPPVPPMPTVPAAPAGPTLWPPVPPAPVFELLHPPIARRAAARTAV
jgi:hypothetical protein